MTPESLRSLLKQEEDVNLEFKEGIDLNTNYGKAKFIKEMLSLVNTSKSQAHLIIGVKDKTKDLVGVGGIKEETLQQIIEDNCKPTIRFSFETVSIEGVSLGVITISNSRRKPHTLKKKFGYSDRNKKQYEISDKQVFIRRGSVIREASVEEIIEMAQEDEDYNTLLLDEMQDIRAALAVIAEHSYYWQSGKRNKVNVENIDLYPITSGLSIIANALWSTLPNKVSQGSLLGALIGFAVGGFVNYQIVVVSVGGGIVGLLLGIVLSGFGIIRFGLIRLIVISLLVGIFVAYEMLNRSFLLFSIVSGLFSNTHPASNFIIGAALGAILAYIIIVALNLLGYLSDLYQHWNFRVRIINNPYNRK